MYYKQQEWLEAVAIDSKIDKLSKQRHKAKVTLCHISHELDNIHSWQSALICEQYRVRAEYHAVDLKMAELDGRLFVVEEVPVIKRKYDSFEHALKALSAEERAELINQLSAL